MRRFLWPSLSLLLLLVSTALVSEFFQDPNIKENGRPYKNPFRYAFLEGITQIHITNRLGELVISRENSDTAHWMLTHPREIEAGPITIRHLLDSLQNIKIRKVYHKDQIHMANFSLDNPIFTVKLTNPQLGTQTLRMGVINPIDESTYILLGNDGPIYQIDSFKHPIETYTFSEFIDARIIPYETNDIKKLVLNQPAYGTKLLLIKDEKNWRGERTVPLSGAKVKQYLKGLTSFRGQMILDKKLQMGNRILTSYLASPLYTLEVTDIKDEVRRYEISKEMAEGVSELKINPNESLVVKASNKDHLYIVGKDFLNLFKIVEKDLLPSD